MAGSRKSLLTGMLILLVYLIYLSGLTLSPFEFSYLWFKKYLSLGVEEGILFLFNIGRFDVFFNILLFIPFGFILFLLSGSRKFDKKRILWLITFFGLFLSCVIEVAQLFLQRSASVIDMIANTIGTHIGYYLISKKSVFLKRLSRFAFLSFFRSLLTGLTGIAFFMLLLLPFTMNHFGNWNTQFHLLLGNEETGDRPWEGEIYKMVIYPMQLNDSQIISLYNMGLHPVLKEFDKRMPMIAFYPFSEGRGDTIHDFSAFDKPLQILGGNDCWLPDRYGIRISSGHILRSEHSARRMVEALQKTSQFSIELWFRVDNLHQEGPARIVSLSDSPEKRNFTLGQQGHDIHFRVRTPLTGLNGATIHLQAHNVLKDTLCHHLVVTAHRGVERIYLDGKPYSGSVQGDSDYIPIVLKMGRTNVAMWFCIFMFSFPFSFMIGCSVQKSRFLWTPFFVICFSFIIELIFRFLFGQPVSLLIPTISGITGLLGGIASTLFTSFLE